MNESQIDTPMPPLEQQMAWSQTVKELLDEECWHAYRRDPISRCGDDGRSLWYHLCVKCGVSEWAHRESIPVHEDGTPVVEDGPVHHMQEQIRAGGANYCTHALAWPALQKMLALARSNPQMDCPMAAVVQTVLGGHRRRDR